MEEFYSQIRLVHISSVIASGGLFALRGAALNFAGAAWTRAMPLRVLSWTIDSVLLTAAFMLMTIVHQYPFVDGWLTTKVVLLVVYIGLGTVALRASRPVEHRRAAFVAAALVFLFIVSVARAHSALGIFSGLV